MKSGTVSDVSAKLRGGVPSKTEPVDQLVAGGVQFDMPASWGRLGATGAQKGRTERIGTIVTAVCPGGGAGATCTGGAQLTFIAYSGSKGHELPTLSTFEAQLDDKLGDTLPGFTKRGSKMRPGADGIRYLDYPFAWKRGTTVRKQRYAAYRNSDGSGVVVISAGPKVDAHAKSINSFLASAHEHVDE